MKQTNTNVHKNLFVSLSVSVKTNFTLAVQEMSLGFIGACRPHAAEVKQAIRVEVMDHLDKMDVCQWAECFHGNISIYCAPPPPRRRKGDLSTFEMRWNVTLQNRCVEDTTCLNRQAGRQAGRQADRQAGRQAGRQAARQTGRQAEWSV